MEVDREVNTSEGTNIMIHSMSRGETTHFLNFYKNVFLNSVDKYTKGVDDTELLIEKIKGISCTDNKIDPKCAIKFNKRLVRIEYPGEVKNVDKAIETLGGLKNIECSVGRQRRKLELHFHPKNRFSKPCVADKHFKPGILIKIKKSYLTYQQPSTSQATFDSGFDYEVIGLSVMNFTFNRLFDFQYLPLISKEEPESKESETDFIYEKIFPPGIPDNDWLSKEELKTMEPFLLPVRFSRYDYANTKLLFDNSPSDKLEENETGDSAQKDLLLKKRKISKIFGKNKQTTSVFINFNDKEIPQEPPESAKKSIQTRALDNQLARVKQLFEERPIWTKTAVLYNTGITDEQSKVVLPMVAYYFTGGPWRISWVKYGYDPRVDPKARIYQTLDYRIRTQDSIKIKIRAKHQAKAKGIVNLGPVHVKRVSLSDKMTMKPQPDLDEKCYVLKPLTIPPARQMFYQLCDLLLPEIQDKIGRLPKAPEVCDIRDGWLPKDFITDCREIVNKNVLDAVQTELLKDKILEEKNVKHDTQKGTKEKGATLDYCNQMLSNIKKGIYTNVDVLKLAGPSREPSEINEYVELINLSDDDEEDEFSQLIQSSIPENMEPEEGDDYGDEIEEYESDADEGEIDTETVEEINKMLSGK